MREGKMYTNVIVAIITGRSVGQDFTEGYILAAPPEMMNWCEGHHVEDNLNNPENLPTEPGIYKCDIEEFVSYFGDGYNEPREAEQELYIRASEFLFAYPEYEKEGG